MSAGIGSSTSGRVYLLLALLAIMSRKTRPCNIKNTCITIATGHHIKGSLLLTITHYPSQKPGFFGVRNPVYE
ncbi:hypothetical protein [Microseira wollei]|uniref:Secreted protein n=1 Tax=Microseira wollei NIES-4236 TaxID=2530354 RepID=A0AAV3XN58_9CYAN|nr:hypothetical protein [Microseira wollei]GET42525.1 hypothetical protein MiSe_73430 [Microseira wollei NIES-4236]